MAIDKERKRAIAKFIKEEMEDKLKLCKSNAHGSTQQRNKCPKKPYQNDTLSCKWNTVSENKKKFKKCQTISEKQTIRAGKHGGNIPVIHAKTIGKLGVHKERQRRILKVITKTNGSSTTETREARKEWKTAYENKYKIITTPMVKHMITHSQKVQHNQIDAMSMSKTFHTLIWK